MGGNARPIRIMWPQVLAMCLVIVALFGGQAVGQGALEQAISLSERVNQLDQEGRYQEAITLAEQQC